MRSAVVGPHLILWSCRLPTDDWECNRENTASLYDKRKVVMWGGKRVSGSEWERGREGEDEECEGERERVKWLNLSAAVDLDPPMRLLLSIMCLRRYCRSASTEDLVGSLGFRVTCFSFSAIIIYEVVK